jgi:sortase A
LRLSVAVVQGDDGAALRRGAGHLPDTPMPWEQGNSAFAGHRDTVFRGLKDAKIGDAISLVTHRGTFAYRVRRITIVEPDNLSVLSDREGADLTLITCYPFTYLGSAPRRFVIHAERSGGSS